MNLQYNKAIIDDLDLFTWAAQNLPLRFVGDAALTTVCEPVPTKDIHSPEIQEIASTMVSVLKQFREKAGVGRGLAANQIGVTKRMIVVWLGDEPEVIINPELVSAEGRGSYWESCLSSGSFLIGEVIRPWQGTFRYLDIHGAQHEFTADEKQTRLFLHEIDHLNGELCVHKYEPGTLHFVEGGKEQILSYPFKKLD